MKYILIYIYILLSVNYIGQNLVPNPSFESYTVCPNSGSQIYYTGNWFGPANNSTDYFNKCSIVSALNPPTCGSGYQDTRTGNGMVGIWVHGGNGNYREYLMSSLLSSLQNNNCYYFSFYCNLANNSKLSIKSLGIAVTSNSYATTGSSSNNVIGVSNPIYKYDNNFLLDTLNWTKVEGIYSANGLEQYIIIGNFKDDFSTDTLSTNHGNYYYSYYMIDDINVELISTPFWSYRDTTVAIGDSVLIGPAITGLNINWYDATGTFITNAPGIYVKPNSPTFYTATEDFCGSVITHTINVGVSPVGLHAPSPSERVGVRLFPNPNNGLFTIVRETIDAQLSIQILDVQGKVIFTDNVFVKNYETTVQASLSNGVYIVSITDVISGTKTVKKLVVQK